MWLCGKWTQINKNNSKRQWYNNWTKKKGKKKLRMLDPKLSISTTRGSSPSGWTAISWPLKWLGNSNSRQRNCGKFYPIKVWGKFPPKKRSPSKKILLTKMLVIMQLSRRKTPSSWWKEATLIWALTTKKMTKKPDMHRRRATTIKTKQRILLTQAKTIPQRITPTAQNMGTKNCRNFKQKKVQ